MSNDEQHMEEVIDQFINAVLNLLISSKQDAARLKDMLAGRTHHTNIQEPEVKPLIEGSLKTTGTNIDTCYEILEDFITKHPKYRDEILKRLLVI